MRRIVKLTARHLQLDLPDHHCGSAVIVARVLETEILAAPTSVILETDQESTWSLSSLATQLTSSLQDNLLECWPMNHNLAASVMDTLRASDLSHADPIIQGLRR
jgi:hypothetical protein